MIKEKIDEFYGARQKNKEKTAFWISDAGKCPRQIWFSCKGYPKKPAEARVQRIFEHGNHTHMRIMSVLFSLGLVTACEVEIPSNEFIHGRADAIISLDGEIYVIEIKSISSFKFKKDEVDSDHVKQLQLYLHFFKIRKGIFIYENKDTQELRELIVEYDEKLANQLLNSFSQLKEKVEKNEIPAIPSDLEKWRCEYCDYLGACEKTESSK